MTWRKRCGSLPVSPCSREIYESTANSLSFLSSSMLSNPGPIKDKIALQINKIDQYQCQITNYVVILPSDSSLRKLFGRSGCIMSPPTENTVFMVSMNHSLSGAYVWSFIGKNRKKQSIKTQQPNYITMVYGRKGFPFCQVHWATSVWSTRSEGYFSASSATFPAKSMVV